MCRFFHVSVVLDLNPKNFKNSPSVSKLVDNLAVKAAEIASEIDFLK